MDRRHPQSLFVRSEHFIGSEPSEPATTGRFLATTLDATPDATKRMLRELQDQVGVRRFVSSRDGGVFQMPEDAEAMVLQSLGIVVLNVDPTQTEALASTSRGQSKRKQADFVVEPEYFCQHAGRSRSAVSADYLRGYRDGLDQIIDQSLQDEKLIYEPESDDRDLALLPEQKLPLDWQSKTQQYRSSEHSSTWGLQRTRIDQCPLSGKGVRVAVIDSGLDLRHPGFADRVAKTVSYVGRSAQDDHGHGTHCAGTLCGQETTTVRYGIARKAELYVAKVLDRNGRGMEANVIAGIEWAINQGCRVISVSIERGVDSCSTGYSNAYEAAGLRAIQQNALVIAAAGNRSRRSAGIQRRVSAPANTPSIVGVGAIRESGRVADFSNRTFCRHGEVDFVAPGVDVFSSDITSDQYHTRNGTSMATPHVSGIAALLIEQDPGLGGESLYLRLKELCLMSSELDPADYGHGMPLAPQ
ncbi:Peptidase S8 and S53, subtilisin, kexin, sedolisin domain protein [Rhodopirellula maiorica SM1]|uniref:Peptidase S8 and S53, subtilisin, kexin, sedolisin domain protein n=1 Tax=Rhodopirellula maiorica SM1 TaxID=1265738 RepID=M5RCI6_9BACT|nr:S8 family serine peptidase [Rhodopirellula maiorica]EMI17095.1 Peptidase S8 and S53, subtilisin, kexin, sedolisin domain protein [Rhodopirellula maiorica SM1]